MAPDRIDPAFRALPLDRLADAALSRARALGATHADVRIERIESQSVDLRDGGVTSVIDATTVVADALDLSVRGAAGVAQAYLAAGDRVGVVALGGIVRWLPPGVGLRQVHRVVETVLDVRLDDSYVAPDLNRLPRRALPPGALVVLFSPLLDLGVLEILRDLRERGHPTVAVDVLRTEPLHLAPAPARRPSGCGGWNATPSGTSCPRSG